MQYDESDHGELNCAGFRSRLDAVLDSRRSPQLDLPLRAHARRCRQCASWLATQTELLEALPEICGPKARPDFALQVVQTVEISCQWRQRRVRRAIVCAAMAAGLVIAIAGFSGRREPDGAVNSQLLSRSSKIPAVVLKQMDEVTQDFKPVSGSVYTALNAIWLAERLL
jgi:hypothetical protein